MNEKSLPRQHFSTFALKFYWSENCQRSQGLDIFWAVQFTDCVFVSFLFRRLADLDLYCWSQPCSAIMPEKAVRTWSTVKGLKAFKIAPIQPVLATKENKSRFSFTHAFCACRRKTYVVAWCHTKRGICIAGISIRTALLTYGYFSLYFVVRKMQKKSWGLFFSWKKYILMLCLSWYFVSVTNAKSAL